MDVLTAAASIGLMSSASGDAFGTIEEEIVLAALSKLAADHPDHQALFTDACARVRIARSAGVERIEANSVFSPDGKALDIQLRYRAEMLDVFTDLAIDLALTEPDPETAAA